MIHRKSQIIDAHTHFFSYTWFQHFYNLAQDKFSEEQGVEAVAETLGWEMPPKAPDALGKRWVEEQDAHCIGKQVLFASKLNDAEQLAAAVHAFPDRLIGYAMIDPTQDQAREQTHYSLNILGMKGIILFPAMHHFHAFDKAVYPIYEEAMAAEAPVFLNFGQLKIPIFQKLGIRDWIDLKYSNPSDLKTVASEFPDVNFIVPHFGCGFFDEAIEMAGLSDNVFFDTASSNSWIQAPLTLSEVFKKSLQVLGSERILFGTDSSCFPRGWRKDIFEVQSNILDELAVPSREQDLIFGENTARLLKLA
ncbi:amidohydrolase family protein [bacterium]|nr:amidohydrolase family protein [bacterium]